MRPPRIRRICCIPRSRCFKPRGIPARCLEQVFLSLDQFEALRLADYEGVYQEEASARMGISRPTFGRVIESARRKVAEALVEGKALFIEGGPVELQSPAPTGGLCCWEEKHKSGEEQ